MKERIVGAAILVALGVWLIPWVLDGPDDAPAPDTSASSLTLPPAGDPAPLRTETVELEPRAPLADGFGDTPTPATEPSAVAILSPESQNQPIEAAAVPDDANVVPAQRSGTVATAREPDRGWAVQVGAFSDIANADQLAARVSTFGFTANISEFRARSETMYRVRVGSLATEDDAEAAASSLSAHGIPVQVIPPE